ncbi:MAG TPA: hypothetical protein VH092_06635 [Urbifossiella sp.]|jgi:hypothetical protein|nr:hypothetical protein [Urbifossiella sp.]
MARIRPRRAVALALFLTTGLLVAADGAVGQPGKDKGKDKDKGFKDKGPGGKAERDLRKAFDALTDLTQTLPAGKASAGLLEQARVYYRAAVRAYPDDAPRAAELAKAANDAARGLEHVRRADARPAAGLPEPPEPAGVGFVGKEYGKGKAGKDDGPKAKFGPAFPGERGPWSEALDELTKARDVLAGVGPAGGPGADFLAAAKGTYSQARTAYESGEYRRAAELARAAEAWAHVPEHLGEAGWDEPAGPRVAPEPQRKGAGAPPAPPPVKQ